MASLPTFTPVEKLHFWSYVDMKGPAECWEWTGMRSKEYGRVFRGKGKRNLLAHRVAYFLRTGEDPEKLCVCHRCDNPPCCNPAHLFLGTRSDNVADQVSKGRVRAGKNHPNVLNPENIKGKLSHAAVREIRAMYKTGRWTQTALARKFGVTQGAVCFLINRHHWKHVN